MVTYLKMIIIFILKDLISGIKMKFTVQSKTIALIKLE